MKVAMTKMEHQADEHAKRFAKNWDYYCIATGAYMSGFREAKEQAIEVTTKRDPVLFRNLENEAVTQLGEDVVEVEISNGEHQLSVMSFLEWERQLKELSFEEALNKLLTTYRINEVRVHTDETGLISFQGTARKK